MVQCVPVACPRAFCWPESGQLCIFIRWELHGPEQFPVSSISPVLLQHPPTATYSLTEFYTNDLTTQTTTVATTAPYITKTAYFKSQLLLQTNLRTFAKKRIKRKPFLAGTIIWWLTLRFN